VRDLRANNYHAQSELYILHELSELLKRNAAIAIQVHLLKNSLNKILIHFSVTHLKQLLNLIGVNKARSIPIKHPKSTR